MVRASGDTGVVTPRQVINAVKTGRFKNAFYKGDAPYQDFARTAAEPYGPAGGRGLGSVLAKAINGSAEHGMTAAVLKPAAPQQVLRWTRYTLVQPAHREPRADRAVIWVAGVGGQ